MEETKLIDMKSIGISNRPNIGVQDMDKYINGGLMVESLETNGVLVYIPYGIYCDIFRAIDSSVLSMKREIRSYEEELKSLSTHTEDKLIKATKNNHKHAIDELKEKVSILESIAPIINEV